jgi:hypothetical protein
MNRQQPIVQYKQPFNTPVIRRTPSQAQPQCVPKPSPQAPKPEKAAGPGPKPKVTGEQFWSRFAEQDLVFQMKSGAIICGKFSGLERNFLKVVDAVITGRANRATVPWVFVEVNNLVHVHPPGTMEKIDE